jgi:group I intron endonuclease
MQFNIPTEHKNASGVYVIRNTVNDKVYVGSTRNFYTRYKGHRSHLRLGKHSSRHMQRHHNKYGPSCFTINLLELITDNPEDLALAENRYIELFDAANPKKGFNNMVASFPARHSAETRAKISAINKGRSPSDAARAKMSAIRKGKRFSEETKQKMREAYARVNTAESKALRIAKSLEARTKNGPMIYPPVSEQTRQKLREAGKGRVFTAETRQKIANSQKGRTPSEETRRKMSDAKKGRPPHNKSANSATGQQLAIF